MATSEKKTSKNPSRDEIPEKIVKKPRRTRRNLIFTHLSRMEVNETEFGTAKGTKNTKREKTMSTF
jgi:hypothetical protein